MSLTKELRIQSLYIYPIKSCGGIEVASARIEERGFQYDRRWALVDAEDVSMDQIKYPRLASVRLRLESDALVAHMPGMEALRIPFHLEQPANVMVRGFRHACEAQRVGDEADAWFNQLTRVPCCLVYMPDTTRRAVNPAFAINDDIVSFASGYPYHLMNTASASSINQLLAEPVPMNRFRPNIVIEGVTAFEEDQWQIIQINDVVFHLVKPCDRCAITTVDQISGERTGKEPLRTLARLRTVDKKVLFGQYMLAEKLGVVHEGDLVQVVKTRISANTTG